MKFFLELTDARVKVVGGNLMSFGKEVIDYASNLKQITSSDVVVLSPAHKVNVDEIKYLVGCSILFAGKVPDEVSNSLGRRYINVLDDDNFAIGNSLLTAENFLPFIITATSCSIYDQKILITGGGKVAQALWNIFSRMGVKFTTTMRDEKQLLLSKIFAENAFHLRELEGQAKDFDTIINTIPSKIFGKNIGLKEGASIFELSSVKCIDEDPQLNYVSCPALPAKYSPRTAGNLLWNVIRETLEVDK